MCKYGYQGTKKKEKKQHRMRGSSPAAKKKKTTQKHLKLSRKYLICLKKEDSEVSLRKRQTHELLTQSLASVSVKCVRRRERALLRAKRSEPEPHLTPLPPHLPTLQMQVRARECGGNSAPPPLHLTLLQRSFQAEE